MAYIGALSGGQSSSSGVTSLFGNGSSSGISGLASGLNTDAIVQGLMAAASVPLVNLLQQRQQTQWKEMQYQQVNQSLTQLQNSLSSLQLQSTFLQKTTSSSNDAVVTASASSLASNGTYNVSVQQLAQGATISSGQPLSTDPNYGNKMLSALGVTGTSITLKVNNGSYTFDPTKTTLSQALSSISGDPNSGVNAFYDPNSGKVVMQTTATGASAAIQVSQDSGNLFSTVFGMAAAPPLESSAFSNGTFSGTSPATIAINGVHVHVNPGDNVGDVANQINQALQTAGNTAVTASVDPANQQLKLTGANLYSPISVENVNNFADTATPLQFSPQTSVTSTAGHDAFYTVNGFQTTSGNNAPTFAGVTFNLGGVTASGSTVTVSVSQNTDALVQNITDFVKQYNTTLQVMQGLYTQQQDYNYQPLTTDQATQLTQTQQDQWSLHAQKGLLGGDYLLGSVMYGLEQVTSSQVSGQPTSTVNGQKQTLNSLASIGVQSYSPDYGVDVGYTAPGVNTTGWGTYGLLEINTDKLTQAIKADPQSVMQLFTNPSTGAANSAGGSSSNSTGIAVQMYNTLTNAITQIQQQAGFATTTIPYDPTKPLPYTPIDPQADLQALTGSDALDVSFLGSQVSGIDSQAADMQQQLNTERQRYLDQFTRMEQALATLNNQSAGLASMSGTGQTSSGG